MKDAGPSTVRPALSGTFWRGLRFTHFPWTEQADAWKPPFINDC